MFFNFKAQH